MTTHQICGAIMGGAFWLKSELFLTKIRTLTFNCRLQGGNPAQRFRSLDGEQNRKIFLTFCNRPLAKIFSIKETKIFLFYLPADAGIAETLSHPQTGRAGKNSFPPDPLFFLPARHARFAGEPPIFNFNLYL